MADVFEIAKTIETEGRDHYRQLAASTDNLEIAGVFRYLADEEEKHYRLFDRMQKKLPVESFNPSEILQKAKTAFQAMAVDAVPSRGGDAESAYRKALGFEQKSVDFYQKMLEDKSLADQAGTIALVLGEERKHVRLVESLIDFVRRPKEWLENAEFNHLDEY